MEVSRGPPRVKNKAAAPVQISAEALLREAVDRQEPGLQAPTQRFGDLEELHEFQGRKRTEFENFVRRNRLSLKNWTQYAAFELSYHEYQRMRSIMERCLDVLPHSVPAWLFYIDAELKSKNVAFARNLLDRAVTVLPRVDKFWYKRVYIEQLLNDYPLARATFERWIQWEPSPDVFSAYIKMETSLQEYDRARDIFQKFVMVHPQPGSWLKWSRWEQSFGTVDDVRQVFGEAVEALGDDFMDEKVFMAYAKYEAKIGETARSRAIYKYALDRLPRSKANILYKAYTTFEKQFGDREGVEDVILSKRRVHYEGLVKSSPKNYDAWLDFARLMESSGDVDGTIEIYERAIAQLPPSQEKRHWRRYIYLWIFYALYVEMVARDVERVRDIWSACLRLIPLKKFAFAKVFLQTAEFEIRQGDLTAARKKLGLGLGLCPKDKLFKGYIALELKLFEFQRCRTLYEQWCSFNPTNGQAWIKFAELERGLSEIDRARAIFELAVSQDTLQNPELVWKSYIDCLDEEGDWEGARGLYERLLEKTNHVKVWISYALFEINVPDDDAPEEEDEEAEMPISAAALARARKIFTRANKAFKDLDTIEAKESRVALLNAWKSFEATHGSEEDKEMIEKQMPRRVKKRRKLDDADEYVEYMDYVFPEDSEGAKKLASLLERAQAWKRQQAAAAAEAAEAVETDSAMENGDRNSNGMRKPLEAAQVKPSQGA